MIPEYKKKDAISRAELILRAYSKTGYHALSIGPKDLALGADFLLERQNLADFPFLCANMKHAGTNKTVFTPQTVANVNDMKIGLIGLISKRYAEDLSPYELEITSPADATKMALKELESRACDLIIVLSQLDREENIELVETVPGIHIVFAANRKGMPLGSTGFRPFKLNGVTFIRTYNRGRYFEKLALTIKDNSPELMTYFQKRPLLTGIEQLSRRLEQLRKELHSCRADAQMLQEMVTTLERMSKDLETMKSCSHYASTRTSLNKTVKEDQDIQNMVEDYKDQDKGETPAVQPIPIHQ